MSASRASEGSRFRVDLGEVKLPPLVEQQVESEIQAVVLRALNTVSAQSETRASQLEREPADWWGDIAVFDWPDRTRGLVARPIGFPTEGP